VGAAAGLHAEDLLLDEHALERPLHVLGVFGGDTSLVITSTFTPIFTSSGVIASMIAVFPESTGPPTPIREIFS